MAKDITDEQWAVLAPLIPLPERDSRGRKRTSDRPVLNGILWILRTGANWEDIPDRYPPKTTCHDRFQEWSDNGTFDHILRALAQDMEERGGISLEECFIDGTFASAKKGVLVLVPRNGVKGQRSWSFATETLFQSPSVWRLLVDTKSPWLKQRLPTGLRRRLQNYW
jgi:transposase